MKLDKSLDRKLKAFEQLSEQFTEDARSVSTERLEQAKRDLTAGRISASRYEQIRADVMRSITNSGGPPPT